jgi:hypothetical protein
MELPAEFPVAVYCLKLAFSALFGILFLQSGFDKLFNFRENLSWLNGHFADSLLGGIVPVLLVIITITELSSGVLSAVGLAQLLVFKTGSISLWGNMLAIISLLCLFLGQRLAKDYAGAASLISYFIAAAAGILIQGM